MKTLLLFLYQNTVIWYYRILSVLSPELNTKIRYKAIFNKELDLSNPKSFKEKLLTLKLRRYIKDPLVIKCADKYAVREYIKEQGCDNILIPLIASYDNVNEIEWEKLPNSFVLKWNFGCGFNIICKDKKNLDIHLSTKKLKCWRRDKSYLNYSEMQYAKAPKKVIAEKYLESKNGGLPADYKVYCFNGEPKAILYMCDRGTEQISAAFFDIEWNFIGGTGKDYKIFTEKVESPVCLEEMITTSKKLSKQFEFVRIDYYVINDKLYFGEMTFTPGGCLFASECSVNGITMGDLLDVNNYVGE